MSGAARCVYTLAKREWVRFVRQRNRVFGALAQPVLFWLIFGAGLNASFRPAGMDDQSYVAYFFPGIVVLILLFTAIFSTISIIEDRNEGFLQSVLVAPIARPVMVLGKLVGTTGLAVVQASLLFALAPLAGVPIGIGDALAALPLLVLIAFGLSGLGFCIAWRMDSTQGFHAVMTAFLMPMWFLSGAFFPANGLPLSIGALVAVNPLTYGVAALRHTLDRDASLAFALPSLGFSVTVVVVFALAMFIAAVAIAEERAEVAEPEEESALGH